MLPRASHAHSRLRGYTDLVNADRVLAILAALVREKVNYKIVGGVALNIHGIVRATEDLDLFIAPDSENVDRLKAGDGWQGSGFVFVTKSGERIDPRNFLRQWYLLLDGSRIYRCIVEAKRDSQNLFEVG